MSIPKGLSALTVWRCPEPTHPMMPRPLWYHQSLRWFFQQMHGQILLWMVIFKYFLCISSWFGNLPDAIHFQTPAYQKITQPTSMPEANRFFEDIFDKKGSVHKNIIYSNGYMEGYWNEASGFWRKIRVFAQWSLRENNLHGCLLLKKKRLFFLDRSWWK